MKNYISKAALALLVALSATGCSGFLDEELKSELAPDNTYTSSYGFEVGSTGLYAEARSEYNTWGENGAYMHNGACPYEALQIATDLATMGTKDGSIQPFGYLTMTPNTLFVKSYWNWGYSLIAGANEMLKYSEINKNWSKPTDKPFTKPNAVSSVLMHTEHWFTYMAMFPMLTKLKRNSESISRALPKKKS